MQKFLALIPCLFLSCSLVLSSSCKKEEAQTKSIMEVGPATPMVAPETSPPLAEEAPVPPKVRDDMPPIDFDSATSDPTDPFGGTKSNVKSDPTDPFGK